MAASLQTKIGRRERFLILLVLAGNASGEMIRLPGHVERKRRLVNNLHGGIDNNTRFFVEGALAA